MLAPVRWITDDGTILSDTTDKTQLLPGKLRLIDQTLLPEELVYFETDEIEVIFDSIKRLVVRGAPAIGCSAALGLASVAQHFDCDDMGSFISQTQKAADRLAESRPTAVNLFWALKRCMDKLRSSAKSTDNIPAMKSILVREGLNILAEDIKMCRSIGEHGVKLIKDGMGLITHCNAGALATSDYGTALSPMYIAHERGINITVYSDETRPLLQGSRLTAWELNKGGVDVITICDNMAGQVMKEGKIDMVIVGSDRIASNGDAANKIGTYGLAILAKYHNIPFYVAAPYSTIDMELIDGSLIPIEEREEDEIKCGFGKRTAPKEVGFYNPAFDVTPNELIAGIITERGILRSPYKEAIAKLFE